MFRKALRAKTIIHGYCYYLRIQNIITVRINNSNGKLLDMTEKLIKTSMSFITSQGFPISYCTMLI